MIRVLVVDDHTIFRAGIARLMSDELDVRVSGEAPDGVTAISMLRSGHYDVVLMDINMGPRSGLETLASIRSEWPRLPVIMLSMYIEPQYARRALNANANSYLSKDVSPSELLYAVRFVSSGGTYMSRDAMDAIHAERNKTEATPHESLSVKEQQVMSRMIRGVSLTEIGQQMCISVKTVASHRARILEKLSVSSNAELVAFAVRHQLLD